MKNVLIALVLTVAGIACTIGGWVSKKKHDALVAEGKTVPGVIMSGEERAGGRRRSRSYKFVVEFTPEGGSTRSETIDVPSSYFKAHTNETEITDDACQVLYQPSDPANAEIVGASTHSDFILYAGPILAIAGVVWGVITVAGMMRGSGA
jgi:hypothetical protein